MIERYLDAMYCAIDLDCSLARLSCAVRWHRHTKPSLLADHDFVMLAIEPIFPLVSSRDVPTQRLPVVLAGYAV